jgi:hypothetical protein
MSSFRTRSIPPRLIIIAARMPLGGLATLATGGAERRLVQSHARCARHAFPGSKTFDLSEKSPLVLVQGASRLTTFEGVNDCLMKRKRPLLEPDNRSCFPL